MPKPVYRDNGKPQETALPARLRRFEALCECLVPFVPGEATGGTSSGEQKQRISCVTCERYAELREAWEIALEWTKGLDHGLTSMLTSIASTGSVGDQLWLKVISCPSSGKSVLCEALSVAKKYIISRSTMTGFYSGFKESAGNAEDNSLVRKLFGKTLVTKDGDPILQAPNRSQILAEARDIYDGASRPHFKNKMSREYEGLRMTWLLCGTSSLRALDDSELGERFLDCVIMEKIDDDLEDRILIRVVNKAVQNLSIESSEETPEDPDLVKAMELTGGYIIWLRENANEVLPTIRNSKEALLMCAKLGKFVSYMRARPSVHQEEDAEREFGARLASQLVRFANCLALVLNEPEVSEKVLAQTTQIAMDTSRGLSLKIVDYLWDEEESCELKSIALFIGEEIYKARRMLRFMRKIGIVETFRSEKIRGIKGQTKWGLSTQFQKLYETVRSG